ncbi:GGDEF domain-containing protein [Pseudoxanthomonas sp. PXM02]|uniref:GGDEF domain-containing protein n=1 Tax=Pseudoxanthomonas sp. PXM02 TaxID=2769294 RepID=UPI00177AB306|nr:GGDEF domain-containing protein [Pseudoxanthomonas sp. PXM02]MBD9480136.1 GGDEF domain-containing protein [Pseudoxanthomonas sp. PXM02]
MLALGSEHIKLLSFAFLILAPLLAGLASFALARQSGVMRGRWNALGLAMMLWAAGMASTSIDELVHALFNTPTTPSVLLFVLYAVPLVFALASENHEDRFVRWTDAALALALGGLFAIYTLTFSTVQGTHPAGVEHLRFMFDVENLFLALFALGRWVTSEDSERRRYFAVLGRYAVVYLLVAAYVNHVDNSAYGQWMDAVIPVPFLLLLIDVLRRAPDLDSKRLLVPKRWTQVARIASPLILPLALLAVATMLISHRPALAGVGFVVATVGYGVRTIRVQMRSSEEQEHLARLSDLDGLTGVANRRRFDDSLAREWMRARRNGDWISLLLLDIDHFKKLNDQWGHHAGDQGIRLVAGTLASSLHRGSGMLARYGGEEFAVILPGLASDEARAVGEDMRLAVERMGPVAVDVPVMLTISVGVASVRAMPEGSALALVKLADRALYNAKNAGRNNVVVSDGFELTAPAS